MQVLTDSQPEAQHPYLSVVLAARHDDYGGNFMGRMQRFVDALVPQLDSHELPWEIVIVEWNPPADRARLAAALRWPSPGPKGSIRIIEVPPEIHARIPGCDRMPMFEYLAKNVGLRRARGRFVLTTNPDLLFSDELIGCLIGGSLDEGAFYRIDRLDFEPFGPEGSPQTPEAAAKRIFQVHARKRTRRFSRWRRWLALWPGSHWELPRSRRRQRVVPFLRKVHTNASGDFLLASAKCWHEIRGFPEYTHMVTHLDSYGCAQLAALGLTQMLFVPPCLLLHEHHDRSEQSSRPGVSFARVEQELRRIREGELGPAINPEGWGLVDTRLVEERLG